MSLYLQIIVYIVIIVGLYLTVITFFDDKTINKKYFFLKDDEKHNVEIWLVTKNIEDSKVKKIENIIENGAYNSIYEITSNFYVKNKNVDM